MKIVFFGTSEFAIPALESLKELDFDLVAIVTQPDMPAGRKQKPLPSPVKVWAEKNQLKVLQPENLKNEHFKMEIPEADLFIVASYGQIIPKQILDSPKLGALNIHPSLLPKYRGASPIHAAILNGDNVTGVTIIKMDEKMDHGAIIAQREKIKVQNKGFGELHDELAEAGAELLVKTLPDYLAGKFKPQTQDDSKASATKIITKDDGRIDWNDSAEKIEKQVRAYEQWPVAWTTLEGKRLKIYKAEASVSSLPSPGEGRVAARPGEVASVSGGSILVNTGSGHLAILELQLEGGKRLSAKDFINGHTGLAGKILV